MHPQRRMRMILFATFGIILFILYITSDSRRVQNQRFYQQTVEAMDRAASQNQNPDGDDGLFQKLRPGVGEERVVAVERQKYESPLKKEDGDNVIEGDIEDLEKNPGPAPANAPDPDEISIAGRKKMPAAPADAPKPKEEHEEDPEVEAELNSILKRSPIIIFSKSYCPFSRRAKSVLLDGYNIVPGPFVVELDLHPLGRQLQQFLSDNTGRKTVPNVLVNGRSIGGGDEIEAMDESGELTGKIKELAGKRVMQMTRKEKEKAF